MTYNLLLKKLAEKSESGAIISGSLSLRTLAEKSKFEGGKHDNLTVREVLNLEHPNYIRWCYFNQSKISFKDDLLDEVKISKDYRIKKPGTDPELGKELEEEIRGKMYGLTKHINEGKKKKERKRELVKYYKKDSIKYSKGAMQSRNQGHRG